MITTYSNPVAYFIQPVIKAAGFTLLGLAVSFALFILMHTLISKEIIVPVVEEDILIVPDFVMDKTEVRPNQIEKLPPPPEMVQPPQMKPVTAESNAVESSDTFDLVRVETPKVEVGGDMVSLPANAQATPMFRMEPRYPPVAARDGIEGWVTLLFDIGLTGEVENIRVLDAEPKRIFDRAAVAALKKWRYKPQLKEGRPMVLTGQSVQLSFSLSEN